MLNIVNSVFILVLVMIVVYQYFCFSRRSSRESSPGQRFFSRQYSNPHPITNLALDSPDSPRVLEVVEKTDSLAWKLEYDEDGELLQKGKVAGGSTSSPGQQCL